MNHLESILALCGGISIIGSAGAVIWKLLRPAYRFQGRVEELERKAAKDFEAIQALLATNHIQNRALLAMMNHMIDGNHIDKLRETRDRLQLELIEQ